MYIIYNSNDMSVTVVRSFHLQFFLKTNLKQTIFVLGLLLLFVATSESVKETRQDIASIEEVNICTDQRRLRCPEGQVLSMHGIICGQTQSSSPTCNAKVDRMVMGICHSHQTCSNEGLPVMFSQECRDHANQIRISFECQPGKTTECRSNLCVPESGGLVCPRGSTIHVRQVVCPYGSRQCPWSTYNAIASLCEGSNQCEASGLRALLYPYCGKHGETTGHVLVNYLCVPGKLVHDSCSSYRYRPFTNSFGVIRLPKAISRKRLTNVNDQTNDRKVCKWTIDSSPKSQKTGPTKIILNVLFIRSLYSKWGCDENFVRIEMINCTDKKVELHSLCELKNTIQLTSCGLIRITSSIGYDGGGDYFIMSYQNSANSGPNVFTNSGLSTCVAPPPPVSQSIQKVNVTSGQDRAHNALLDAASRESRTNEKSNTGSFNISLKMLLLYIFLGALIIVLLVALIIVLVRYRRISIPKKHYGDSSENVILWKRYNDTALDIFQQNGLTNHTHSLNTEPEQNSNKVVATVHHDPMPETEVIDNRISTSSGISSFLPPKRNSGLKELLDAYQLKPMPSQSNSFNHDDRTSISPSNSKYDYYELSEHGNMNSPTDIYQSVNNEDDIDFGGHYSNPNSLARPTKNNLGSLSNNRDHHVLTEDYKPLVIPDIQPQDNYHYSVNDDEYAIVQKPRKLNSPTKYNSIQRPHIANGVYSLSNSNDFYPTSGPYDRQHNGSSLPSYRKSREAKWRDEV